jgi:hypothetical protein
VRCNCAKYLIGRLIILIENTFVKSNICSGGTNESKNNEKLYLRNDVDR